MEARSKLVYAEADGCAESDVFVDLHGSVICSFESLHQLLQEDWKNRYIRSHRCKFTDSLPVSFPRDPPRLYKFDHQFPCLACTEVPVVILYGQLGTARFAAFHSVLSEMAANKEIVYTVRHFYKVSFQVGPLVL